MTLGMLDVDNIMPECSSRVLLGPAALPSCLATPAASAPTSVRMRLLYHWMVPQSAEGKQVDQAAWIARPRIGSGL